MIFSLGFKILGSFALIVILALAAAVGTGARLTRARYDDFAYQQDMLRAESLATVLGSWTAQAVNTATLPPLPSALNLYTRSFRKKTNMMMGRMMRYRESNQIVVTDLSGRVILDTHENNLDFMAQKNIERISIKYRNEKVGYLYVGRMIPDFHPPEDIPFLDTAMAATWLVTAVIFVFSMVLGLILTRHITRPINILNNAASRVEEGDLTVRVPDTRRDELGDLSRGFNSMTGFLESADQQRRRLIVDSAHELRTPVSLIRTRIEMMEEGIYSMDRENLSALSTETTRLIHLVDELKTLAGLESPEMKLSRKMLSLSGVISDVVEACRPEILRQGVHVKIQSDSPLPINGDREKLQRLLSNLLSNALRYAEKHIIINANLVRAGSDLLEFRMEDDGRGIPEEDRKNVFQRYYRVDASRKRSSGGSGIGLAICSEIVRAHGGSIEVNDSRTLGGAEFRVILSPGYATNKTEGHTPGIV